MAYQGTRPRRAIGRSNAAILALGREIQERYLTPEKEAPPSPPSTREPNVLTIASVQFAARVPAPFHFDGYPELQPEDLQFPIGGAERSLTEKLEIPVPQQALIELTGTLVSLFRGNDTVNAFDRFSAAFENTGPQALMSEVLHFLGLMKNSCPNEVPLDLGLLTGARHYFQKEFSNTMERVVRTGVTGRRAGTEMDAAHLCTTFARTMLDNEIFSTSFTQTADVEAHGWRVLYVAIRSGDFSAARVTALKLRFPHGLTRHTPSYVVETWFDKDGLLPTDLMSELVAACQSMMMDPSTLSPNDYYLIRTLSFMCAHFELVETLMAKTGSEWDSLEEYLWFLLTCVRYGPYPPERGMFTLRAFQEKIQMQVLAKASRPAQHMTALLATLQFKKAVKYLMGLEDRQTWFVCGVHLIVALEFMGMLDAGGPLDEASFPRAQMAEVVNNYANTFAHVDTLKYFQYRFFANKLASDPPQTLEEAMFDTIIEYLMQDKKKDVFLSDEAVRLIRTHASRSRDKNRLFFDVAKRLKEKGNLTESYKCFKAGEYNKEALQTISQLISEKIGEMYTEKLMETGDKFGETRNYVQLLLDHVPGIYQAISPTLYVHAPHIRQLYQQTEALQRVFNMVVHYHNNGFQDVVDDFESMNFIPKQDTDITRCVKLLSEQLPLILSILHKIVGLYCHAVVIMTRTGARQSPHQFRRYQEFVQQLPNSCSFKSQITATLARAVSALSDV